MSKKRTAAESSNDEQATEGSDPVSQQQSDAKRAKLVSLSDTKLEDLPIELLECIIVKVVAMEVKDMKLAKSVWSEKSELVINRLRTVCSKWSSICATIFFRNELHRTLDAPDEIRLEILHQYPIQFPVHGMTSMKDEIFMLCWSFGPDYTMRVFDCSNIAEVKDVIPLPGLRPGNVVSCSVLNCLYVHHADLRQSKAESDSILRIKKDEEHQFTLSNLITDLNVPLSLISVADNGNVITISRNPDPTVVSIYAPNGSLQHVVVLSPAVYGFRYVAKVIQKSNGNLVMAWFDNDRKNQLVEMDVFGSVLRRFQSALSGATIGINFADIYERIFITNWNSRLELVDSELNCLDFTGVQPYEGQFSYPSHAHFNRERNEIMHFYRLNSPIRYVLAIFRCI